MRKEKEIFVSRCFEETQELGEEFVKRILFEQALALSSGRRGVSLPKKSAYVIALYGDLGSGKTTFVQGMAKGLGIKRRIISPTFVIIRSYQVYSLYFYHIDLYRVEGVDNIKGLGLEEIINDHHNIVAIEWAEKMGDLLPKKRWDVGFEDLGEDERRITIKIRLIRN